MGMQVIFGTPTATPPAWLTEKYPEVLNASIEGVPYRHGLRRLFALNYQPEPVTVTLKGRLHSLLTDGENESAYTLPPYGVQVWAVQM